MEQLTHFAVACTSEFWSPQLFFCWKEFINSAHPLGVNSSGLCDKDIPDWQMSAIVLIISLFTEVCIAIVPEVASRTETRNEVWIEGSKEHTNLYSFMVLFPHKEEDAFNLCKLSREKVHIACDVLGRFYIFFPFKLNGLVTLMRNFMLSSLQRKKDHLSVLLPSNLITYFL